MKSTTVRGLAVMCLLTVVVWVSGGCGKGKSSAVSHTGVATRAQHPSGKVSLASVIRDIDSYPVPAGVNKDLWAKLVGALKDDIAARSASGKTFSSTATGTNNAVSDLAASTDVVGTQATVTWTEKLGGDCNNDGSVDIADLQPIAAHYGETSTGPGSAAFLADANGDGPVDITDLQPIVADYTMHIEGYRVYRGHWNGASIDWEATPRPNSNVANPNWSDDRPALPPQNARPSYTYMDDLTSAPDNLNVRYKVMPYGDADEGVESNIAVMPPPPIPHNISGTVLDTGVGVAGVTILLWPGALRATTQADGTYTIAGAVNGGYTLIPLNGAYNYTPINRPVTVSGSDVTGQDFAATPSGLPLGSPWPKFHGDSRNTGQSPYVGPQTSATRWTFTSERAVKSSPVIGSDGTVFIGAYLSSTQELVALNPTDGSIKWQYDAGSLIDGSPAIGADGTICFGNSAYDMNAVNSADGTPKWSTHLTGPIYSSPAIAPDGTVYVGNDDGQVVALNPANGSIIWTFLAGNSVRASPAIGADGTIYIGSIDRYLYALNPLDGSTKWSFSSGGYVYSSPAIGTDGTIYFGSNDRYVYALYPNGSLKWSYNTGEPVEASPAIGPDGTIYVGSYIHMFALDGGSGALKWTFDTTATIQCSAAVGADGKIYFGDRQGVIYALNPDGTQKWMKVTGAQIMGSPAIGSDGTLYLGSDDKKLYAIGP